MACSRCGGDRRPQTTMTDRTAAARVGTSSVRYSVNGKKFATLTAAQDYAQAHPGSVIRQL